jgi:hypothetical protein
MRKYLIGFVAGVALMIGAPVAAMATSPAHSTTVHIVSTPDDGNPPWARDTMSRKTTVTEVSGGYKVTIVDKGTFVTPAGIEGSLNGGGTWMIAGGMLRATPDTTSTIDRSGATEKGTFTGSWWQRFLTGGESVTFSWGWTYATDCQTRTESSAAGVQGDYPSKACPTKPTPSVSVSSSASASPTSSHSASASVSSTSHGTGPSTSTSAAGTGALAITGPNGWVMGAAAAGLILDGIAAFVLTRRRRINFTS